ncbi:hypothetical protein BN1723_015357 [Verticillium longisporum]|uniref:Rhodopsin domain-containing protein n=1 Tax=Verticillium longisporum TaxID=100787 RepID=A0A0G4MWH5_VERLO|nr:hypothetical protein BN1723_015357 [Verticillium longisporum]
MADLPTIIRTETRGPMGVGIAVGFISASVLCLAGRFYTRGVILGSIGKDDWSILVATIFSLVDSIAICFEVKYGLGRHSENVSAAESAENLKWLLVGILSYNLGINVVKLGFLFQYRRIFEQPIVQKVCYWFIIFVCMWTCVQVILLSLACLPISFIVPSMIGKCLDTLPIWYFSSGMSMATDIMIFCIPIPSVLKLQLPLKQRMLVLAVFCLGFFVCIISIYRMFTLRAGVISTDPSWDNISVAIWSCLELNVAIIASSLPTLRPLIARILPGAGLSSARNYRNTYHRYGSASAAMAHTGFQSTESRSQKMRSTSTEELALDDFRTESPAASVPNGIHSHVSSDTSKSFYLQDNPEEHRIVKTTEISVDVRER